MDMPEKDNDHKRLGRELDLFTFSDTVGKGLPLWTPKGSAIRREIERFIVDEEIKRDSQAGSSTMLSTTASLKLSPASPGWLVIAASRNLFRCTASQKGMAG